MTQWFLVYSQCCLTITIIWSQNIFITPSPGDSDGKESPCNEEDLSSIHGSGRSPGEGNGYPLQYSCLEDSMVRGAWGGGIYHLWGCKESDMTEQLTLSFSGPPKETLYH